MGEMMKIFCVKFTLLLFLLSLVTTSCDNYRNALQEWKSKYRKDEIRKQFNEEYPTYRVNLILLKQPNEEEQTAMILYDKPEVKGAFVVEWKYFNKDVNFDDYEKEWQLIEKGGEGQLATRNINQTEILTSQ